MAPPPTNGTERMSHRIFDKLGVRNNVELARLAIRRGLVEA